MLRWPKEDKKEEFPLPIRPVKEYGSLKQYILAERPMEGDKFKLDEKHFTLVDRDLSTRKYIFSMDELVHIGTYKDITYYLKELYENGHGIFTEDILKEIDFFFIPTEYQIFGKDTSGKEEINTKQFEYYKKGSFYRIKSYQGETNWYWLSNENENSASSFCIVDYYGHAGYSDAGDSYGIPIFFQISLLNN